MYPETVAMTRDVHPLVTITLEDVLSLQPSALCFLKLITTFREPTRYETLVLPLLAFA